MADRVTSRSIASTTNQQSVAQRALVIVLVSVALLLLVMDQRGNPYVKSVRSGIAEVTMPLVSLISKPIETIQGAADWVGGVFVAHSENARLRDENARLKQWMISAHQLEAQNNDLKALLNVPVVQATNFVTARAVADQRGVFARALMIDAGSKQGVMSHQPVVGEDGLVGRVVEVHPNHARVLLVSDINSRIAVKGVDSDVRTLVVGRGDSQNAGLKFVEEDASFAKDELLVTIGTEMIPAGIPVARILGEGEAADVQVQWLQPAEKSDYFRIIQYQPIPTH